MNQNMPAEFIDVPVTWHTRYFAAIVMQTVVPDCLGLGCTLFMNFLLHRVKPDVIAYDMYT